MDAKHNPTSLVIECLNQALIVTGRENNILRDILDTRSLAFSEEDMGFVQWNTIPYQPTCMCEVKNKSFKILR